MPFRYPVALELTGRRCVVIGGGWPAEARVRSLLEADARVLLIATDCTDGLTDLARRGEIDRAERPYRAGDLAGALLAFVTGDDAEVRAAVFAEAEERGVLCNSIDDVPHCTFAVPSVLRRGDLVVTVSTGGRSPALAKRLRRRLEAQVAWEYAGLLDAIGEVRAELLLNRPVVDFDAWAGAWARVLDEEDVLLALVAEGATDAARERIRATLSEALDGSVPSSRVG